jgi:arylformamidase
LNTESNLSRLNYDCHLNIAYGPTKREKLDIYGDDLPKSAPLFIFVHGGYWQIVNKEDSAFMVKPLYENGIRCMTIDYDLCPNVSLEEIVEQVKKCFKWIAAYINENQIRRVVVSGHSVGAHLLNYGLNEEFMETITSAVELHAFYFSGIYYLEELRYLKTANEDNKLQITDENCRRLSPQYIDYGYFRNYNVKAYVFASEFESEMLREHAKKFAEGPIKEFLVTFKICENLDHFDMVERLSESDYELSQLIIKTLKI